MSVKFPIISISKKRKRIRTLSFISIPVLTIFQFFLHESGYTKLGWITTGFLILALFLSFIIIRIYSKYEITGNIILDESSIIVSDKMYSVEIIEIIKVIYKSYKGEPSGVTLMGYFEGEKNLFEFRLNDGEVISHLFRSTNKRDYALLRGYLSKFEKAGIQINLTKTK